MNEEFNDSYSVAQKKCANLLSSVVISLFIVGCSGSSTTEEVAARKQLADVTAAYRTVDESPLVTPHTSLQELVTRAIRQSPLVQAAYFDWVKTVEGITVERSLPDPNITFEADIQDVVMAVIPGLMLDLPGPGKLSAKAAVAAAEAQMKYAEFRKAVLISAANFKKAYFELQALEDTIAVNKRNLKLVHELRDIAQVQHSAGRASLQDLLRADIESDELAVRVSLTGRNNGSSAVVILWWSSFRSVPPTTALGFFPVSRFASWHFLRHT